MPLNGHCYLFSSMTIASCCSTNVMVVRGSNAVIQSSIKAADPSVQVEHISWKFIASGMSSIIDKLPPPHCCQFDRLTLTIIKARLNNTGVHTITVSNVAGKHLNQLIFIG